jgi:hypothetical protein
MFTERKKSAGELENTPSLTGEKIKIKLWLDLSNFNNE